jgi:type I restriction enzyme S subunit
VSDWSNRSIRTLVDGNAKFQAAIAGEQVWNLNLDQIESHGGRVLKKVYVSKESLGPSTYAFEPRTVLYSKLRPYLNKVVVADEAGYATTELVPLRCKPNEVHPEYLAYFLRSSNFLKFANMVVAGAKMPRMVMSEFWDFTVPIPPLPEQRRISAILDHADALRAKRRESLAQLDSLTQSIFIEMFGDPTTNPKQWRFVALDQLVRKGDTINYGVVQPGDALDEGIPIVRVGDVVDGNFDSTCLKRIDPTIEAAYKRSRLKGDEILVTCVGSIGVVALVEPFMKGYNIARAVSRIPASDAIDRTFLASYLQTDFVQRYFTSELRTVSQPTLNIKQICETKVIQSPLPLQQSFAALVQSVEALIATHKAALQELDRLFASLQHRAFAGEL